MDHRWGGLAPLSENIRTDTREWRDYFLSEGYRDPQPLAAGVEGAIYRLGDETVAKVWARRKPPELVRMQHFYEDLAQAGLPFLTPRILRVEEVAGVAVTFDRELPGTPLQERLSPDDETIPDDVADVLADILAALSGVSATEHMRQMAVIDERQAFWHGAVDFHRALVALLERRVARFGDVLREHVEDFDDRYRLLLAGLAAVDPVPPTVLHGDLFAENVLVDSGNKPTAVLDFGFLSSAGDPRLDAAITAVITNMYGPHARTIAASLTDRFSTRLGYPTDVLLLYRAAYAVATANFLTADGSDGHFTWCVGWLNDPLVTAVLDR